MARVSEGLTEDVRVRATSEEAQMVRDIAAHLGLSQNKASRWALRVAWHHATSTDNHTACPPNSPCAAALRGITPGAKRPPAAAPDQMTITHSATVEEP